MLNGGQTRSTTNNLAPLQNQYFKIIKKTMPRGVNSCASYTFLNINLFYSRKSGWEGIC